MDPNNSNNEEKSGEDLSLKEYELEPEKENASSKVGVNGGDKEGSPPQGRNWKKKAPKPGIAYCGYFLQKKSRHCRLTVIPDQLYCVEHILEATVVAAKSSCQDLLESREKCPYDQKHTYAVEKREEHLRKCNSRPPAWAYYQQGVNLRELEEVEGPSYFDMTSEKKIDLIMKIIDFHRLLVPSIQQNFGLHESLAADMVRSNVGEHATRHATQVASIVNIMEVNGLIKDSTYFVEFGSGRGGLTYGLERVIKAKGFNNCFFLLVDKKSPRYKWENKIQTDVRSRRIQVNIADLVVGKLPGIEGYENIVGLSKHLCGAGTDIAIRSLLTAPDNVKEKIRGIVMATCCHHRTDSGNLIGSKYLMPPFAENNFIALKQIGSWATNGDMTTSFLELPDEYILPPHEASFFDKMQKIYPELMMKHTIGRLMKENIDQCRIDVLNDKLREIGLIAKLVYYVDKATTPENVAIVASPEKKTDDLCVDVKNIWLH